VTGRSAAGSGISGKFPLLIGQETEPLVFQSCIEVSELETVMDGYFTFRYLRDGEIPNEGPEKL